MKTLLLASTALVATAGIAAAEFTVSGSAEIGIMGGDGVETQFFTDSEVTFSGSGETDGGLAFGASVQLDEPGAANPADDGGATYFLSYGGLRLDMGDTDGAYDAAMQEVALAGGSIADDETAHAGYNGNGGLDGTFDGQIARATYTAAGFSAGLSVEVDDSGAADAVWGLGAAYSTDMGGTSITVGVGYQTQEDTGNLVGVSAKVAMSSGLSLGINFSEFDPEGGADNITHTAVGVGYSMNALSIGANYGVYAQDGADDISGFGLAATYDLGGGLAAHLGYGNSDFGGGLESDSFSLGLSMSF
ncbi:MAG: porin [Shimia sp.]|uniref:porin n=1 Tax=Shimia sp. TaxID=1954381 RepID=UPI001B07A82E|nr:porin [Shimia sp.]MBO6899614.1 porin [Shimia sp.]